MSLYPKKCDTANRQLCLPMMHRTMGKFSDGTLRLVSKWNPEAGKDDWMHAIILAHPKVEPSISERLMFWRGFRPSQHSPMPLELNFCPWCGANLNREKA